MFDMTEPGPW